MKKIAYFQIGSRLESAGIVEPEVIRNALTTSRTMGRPMISLLMRNVQRYNDEEMETNVKRVISEILEIPFFTNPGDCTVDQSLTKLIGLNKIEKQMAFVVMSNGRRYLHTLDPMDAEIVAPAMNALKGYDVSDCCMASPACISSLMTREIMPMLIADKAKEMDSATDAEVQEHEEAEVTDIGKMFNNIISAGISSRASDIHLSPEKRIAKIRMRVDGVMREYMDIPLSVLEKLNNYIVSQAKIPEPDKAKEPRDGAMEFRFSDEKDIFLRISILTETDGRDDISIRVLNNKEMTLDQLGMSQEHQNIISGLFQMTKGIVLFVGPTGSGKSTSMYAGLRATDYVHRRVMTCEDPVEQTMEGILQVSINDDAGLSYNEAIKSFLRHDPDIIGIGEIRDNAVGMNAMRASETGHLVISTLHCNDAPSAVSRLRGIDIPAQSIASSLSAVIAQRLVRRVCPNCREKYMLPKDHPWRELFDLGDGDIELVRGKGCPQCDGVGYKGRAVLAEIMVCNREIRAAIEENAPSIEIERLAEASGYVRLVNDGIQKALDGVTTFDEIESIRRDIV